MKNSKKDAGTAYHEAGHVVVSWCLGVEVIRATIVPDNDSSGHVIIEPEMPSTSDAIDRWHPYRLYAEKLVMVRLAGDVAQRRYNSYSVRHQHSQNDRKSCYDILCVFAADEKKLDVKPHYEMLRNWTAHLIEQNWHLVKAVAKALLDCPVLFSALVLDAIRAANQKQTGIDVQVLLDVLEAIRSQDAHTE